MAVGFQQMTSEQREHVDALAAAWPAYADLLRRRPKVVGGMQWKRVGGHEYLTRYWQDSNTGKKVARSLGRRSPETEASYAAYETERGAVRAGFEETEPRIEMLGRMAKALRLARLPSKIGHGLLRLWARGMIAYGGPLVTLGVPALCGYEMNFRLFMPNSSLRSEDVVLFWRARGEPSNPRSIAEAFLGCEVVGGEERLSGSVLTFEAEDGSELAFSSLDRITSILDDLDLSRSSRDELRQTLTEPPVDSVSVARDATPVGVVAMPARAYGLLSPLLIAPHPETLFLDREALIAEMVNRFDKRLAPSFHSAAAEIREAVQRQDSPRI